MAGASPAAHSLGGKPAQPRRGNDRRPPALRGPGRPCRPCRRRPAELPPCSRHPPRPWFARRAAPGGCHLEARRPPRWRDHGAGPGRGRRRKRAGGRTCFASSVRRSLPGLAGAAAQRAWWGALTGSRSSPLHSSACLARSLPPSRPFPHPRPRPQAHRDSGADGAALGARRPRPGWNPAAGTPRGRSIPGLHAAASAPPPGGRGRAGGAGAAAGRGRRGGAGAPGRGGRTVGAGRAGQAAGLAGGGGRAPGSATPLAVPPQTPRERSLRRPPSCFLVPSQSAARPSASSANQPSRPALAPPANPAFGSPLPVSGQSELWVGRPNAGGSTRRPGEAVRGVVGPGGRGTVRRVVAGADFLCQLLGFALRLQTLSPYPMVTRLGSPNPPAATPPTPRKKLSALARAVTLLHRFPILLSTHRRKLRTEKHPTLSSGCAPQGKPSVRPAENQARINPPFLLKGPQTPAKGPRLLRSPSRPCLIFPTSLLATSPFLSSKVGPGLVTPHPHLFPPPTPHLTASDSRS